MKGPSWDCEDEDVRGRTGSSRVAMEVILSTLRSWTEVELVYFTPQAIEPLGGWASKPVQNTRYVGTEHQSFRVSNPRSRRVFIGSSGRLPHRTRRPTHTLKSSYSLRQSYLTRTKDSR